MVVSNIFFFTPTWGNDPVWLYNIFQMGWNHQLVIEQPVDQYFIKFKAGISKHVAQVFWLSAYVNVDFLLFRVDDYTCVCVCVYAYVYRYT